MKYLPVDDFARLDYGRLLWTNSRTRARLLAHWTDPRHPYRERFAERRALVEAILSAPVKELDAVARHHDTSLRAILREIPPVFGHFWRDSLTAMESERSIGTARSS
jgi:hypothetical protein